MPIGLSLGFVAARRIVRDLYQVRELTEIKRPDNDENVITKGTEDGMQSMQWKLKTACSFIP